MFVDDGLDYLRMRSMGPLKFTSDGDSVYPLTQAVRDIDVPIHRLRRPDGGMLVAIGNDAMEVFDVIYSNERAEALASLRAERAARANAMARIESFNSLPPIKRVWRAIRKAI